MSLRRIPIFLCFLLGLGIAFTGPATRAADGGGAAPTESELMQKTLFELPKLGSVFIQFQPLIVPIDLGKRGVRNGPVTVLVTVAETDQVGRICQNWPRVNNALLSAWFAKPVDVSYLRTDKDDHLHARISRHDNPKSDAEDARLIGLLNKALNNVDVQEIRVYNGVRAVNQGSMGKLPFGRTCTLWVRKTPEQLREERDAMREKEKATK